MQRQQSSRSRKIWVMLRELEETCEEMFNAIRKGLSNAASSDNDQLGDEEEDDTHTEVGKLSKDDEPGCMMGTISKLVLHCADRDWQKQMMPDEST
jgi:hypothetical protein